MRSLLYLLCGIAILLCIYQLQQSSGTQDYDLETPIGAFTWIYESDVWGVSTHEIPFNSGPGSHDRDVVDPYIAATRNFISQQFTHPPDIVDLGCGDFNVGRQLRNATSRYIACDVVPAVIAHNRRVYSEENVDFRVLDIVDQDLPGGDLVIVRQVLQHLRNEQIERFLPKLSLYRWAIVTEHLPIDPDFTPNINIELVGSVRTLVDSGIELTETPFNLRSFDEMILSETKAFDGRIRTTAYRMQTANYDR